MTLILFLLLLLATLLVVDCTHEEIEFVDAPQGVAWAVQISDLHISPYHPHRAEHLELFGSHFLRLVQPALVLITGDLTDAKNRDLTVTRQDEGEWRRYRESMTRIMQQSGLSQRVFFDLRGNHDKFGVPHVNSDLDFFSRYSISASMNRTDAVQSVLVKVPGGWRYLFLGFDDTMAIGLRGPTNLFGHPTDSLLSTIDSRLESFSKEQSPDRAAKVVFGHFPMSFTASTESGKRLEKVLAKHAVSAYVCGHLHTKFGLQLYKLHSGESVESSTRRQQEFWEWEMGDWRGSRTMRVISIDHGHVSFVDTSVRNLTALVLPTYPLDSRFMKRNPPYIGYDEDHGDSVRALIFSDFRIVSVTAKIYDRKSSGVLVDELEMHPVPAGKVPVLYKAFWRRNRYSDPSAVRYWLEVSAVDEFGKQITSKPRPFSVDGRLARLGWGLKEFAVMHVPWAVLYPILFWLNIVYIAGVELLLPRLALFYLQKQNAYKHFASSVLRQGGALKAVAWIFIEGSRSVGLWWGQLVLVLWLAFFPWFWGLPFGEGHGVAYATYRGWRIGRDDLGCPDIMVIVLPFLYMVVLPLTTVIACMSAERAACETRRSQKRKSNRKKVNDKPDSGLLQLLEREEEPFAEFAPHSGSRWMRKALLACCLLLGWMHWRQCYWIAAAYGLNWILASPAFTWSIPLLTVWAVYHTAPCGKSPSHSS